MYPQEKTFVMKPLSIRLQVTFVYHSHGDFSLEEYFQERNWVFFLSFFQSPYLDLWLNIIHFTGMTSLCSVCYQGNIKIADILMKAGARVNISDDKKSLPLHYAARNGNLQLVEELIKRGKQLTCKFKI